LDKPSWATLLGVWFCVVMLLWSLAQTLRAQKANYVERSDQWIRDGDVRFDSLRRAAAAAGGGAAGWSSASAATTVPSSSAPTASEDELLLELPDLSEFIPGFMLEWSDVCGPGVSVPDSHSGGSGGNGGTSSQQQVLHAVGASPSSTRLLLSKRVPLGSGSNTPVSSSSATGSSSSMSMSSSLQLLGAPGSTPRILLPTLQHKINGCRRWCTHCQLYKPDRAHHCAHCGRCVKKADHHCVFIAACIGFANYKHFLLFLFYAWMASLLIVLDCLHSNVLSLFSSPRAFRLLLAQGGGLLGGGGRGLSAVGLGADGAIVLTFVLIVAASVAMALPAFMAFHAFLLLVAGRTTIEWNETPNKLKRFLGDDGEGGLKRWPFRLTPFQNFKHVFGFSLWKWLLPIAAWPSNKTILATAAAAASAAAASTGGTTGSSTRRNSLGGSSGPGSILRTTGRGGVGGSAPGGLGDGSGSPGTGEDRDLDELSAVPLLSSLSVSGSPIGAAVAATAAAAGLDVPSFDQQQHQQQQQQSMSKSVLATVELARWESRHGVPAEHSKLARLNLDAHPLYDRDGVQALANAQTDVTWASRSARLRAAAQGLLGQEEATCIAELQARGLMFATHAGVVNPQMELWRRGKLFKQA
jgi:hypothetical protein